MLYKKISIACAGAEDRLNRVLQVRSDVDLLTLGYIILASFNADFTSPYVIEDGDLWYVFDNILADNSYLSYRDSKQQISTLSDHHLNDLSNSFSVKYFCRNFTFSGNKYDDPWEFNCTVDKKEIRLASDLYAIMLDGKGMGLWEDQKNAYFNYLKGKIDPDADFDVKDAWIPENLDIETYGETDSLFDLEIAKEDFEDDMYPACMKDQVEMAVSMIGMDYDDDDWDDDEDDDDDWDEDDDYDDGFGDFFDHMDEDQMADSIMSLSLLCAISHTDRLDFVNDKFIELSKKYGTEEALLMISQIVVKYLEEFMDGSLLENNKEYRKKIKNLK